MHSKPVIFVVGADKGGVGKTTVTRAFLDFLDARGVSNRAFDTENEVAEGVRKRFFPERTEIVNLRDSDDQMKVFDTISGATATVIDVRAGLLSPTRQLLDDIGFLDPSRFGITIMHVLGNNQASIDELAPVAQKIAGMRHIAIGNHINDTKFAFPAGAVKIPMLSAKASEAVDRSNSGFAAFGANNQLAVLSGTVKKWLKDVFTEFDRVKLP